MTSTTLPPPTNPLVSALLTDVYQVTMAYAHWKNNRHEDDAVFELFFRKNPFEGEYTVFCGLDECLKFISHFQFTASDIQYLRTGVPALAHCDAGFFDWLAQVDTSAVKVDAMLDGTVCFPRVPLLIVTAPLAIGQLLETTLLTLINYPSLLCTNAARMVLAAKSKTAIASAFPRESIVSRERLITAQEKKVPTCIEFGLRRAQGPDGGFTASKYSYVGGFVGTSNIQAGKHCGMPTVGTHAHAFVQAYSSLDEVKHMTVRHAQTLEQVKVLPIVLRHREELARANVAYSKTNDGELAAFIAYAVAFPDGCLCLIDTYDTLASGLLNFILVALALDDCGYKAKGIRLDSGDLAYLSLECAKTFAHFAIERPVFSELGIVASNDINEAVLHAINKEGHAVTAFGIGTNLVTCQAQPALGGVYKLVEIKGKPRMKLSQDIAKVLIPGKKKPYRLYGKDGRPLLDLMVGEGEEAPKVGERIICRHPFEEQKRAAVTPSHVKPLHTTVFDKGVVPPGVCRSLQEARDAVAEELSLIRSDILRYSNPTPYKVSVSEDLFRFLHTLWQSEIPVAELS